MAMPWLKLLVARLSPQRHGCTSVQSKWDLWTNWRWDKYFLRVISIVLCQYHPTGTPYSFVHPSPIMDNLGN